MIFDRLTYIDRRTQNNEVKQIGNPRNLGFWCQFSVSIKFIPQYLSSVIDYLVNEKSFADDKYATTAVISLFHIFF